MHLYLLRHRALTSYRDGETKKNRMDQPIPRKEASLRTAVHQYSDMGLKENILSFGETSKFGLLLAECCKCM